MSCIRWLSLLLLLVGSGASAQQEGLPWMLSLSAVRDENAYEHAVGSFHLGVAESTWLSAVAGSSHAPSVEADVRARLLGIDIEHDFGPAGFALGVESWGDEDNLESSDVRAELFFRRDRFRVGLNAERRDIDIFFSADGAPRLTDLRQFVIEAEGLGLGGRYRISDDWQIYGSWMEYDYPQRIRVVPRADRLSLLSVSTVTLAYSFVDYFATVGFEKSFGQTLLNVDVMRDRSAIDQSELSSVRAAVLIPVALRLDIEVAVGRSRLESGSSSYHGGITFLVYGGG